MGKTVEPATVSTDTTAKEKRRRKKKKKSRTSRNRYSISRCAKHIFAQQSRKLKGCFVRNKYNSIAVTSINMRYDVLTPMIADLPDVRDGSFLFLKTAWGSDRQKMVMTVAANQLSHQQNGCKLGPKDGRWNPAGKVNALEVL
jgi:hypothetical protein